MITISVTGVREAIDDLTGMARRIDDPRPAFREIRQSFYRIEEEQFNSNGARGGNSWAPLRPGTIRQKGGAGQTLVRTGSLLASLTQAGARYAQNRVTSSSLELGTTHPAAVHHQYGTRFMAARPIIGVVESDVEAWSEIMAKYVVASS